MKRPVGREHALTMISRRQFLAPLVLTALRGPAAVAFEDVDQSGDRLMKVADLSALQYLLTANEAFYVRNHFATPRLSLPEWKLQIVSGAGSHREVSYADLLRHPARTLTVTLECAGNGVGSGGVSTATWTGIPLAALLTRASLSSATKHIRFIGADTGVEIPSQPPLAYARSIPLAKAMHPDTLLAVQMNGSPLPPEHGYPLRLIVPGWYGMDSVKWLTRIEALDHADASLFMTQRYTAVRLQAVGSERRVITRMLVKSLITEPHEGEVLTRGPHTIRGVAWAGENRVARVEVSMNGGQDWARANLEQDVRPYSWVLWTYSWDSRATGAYTIVARAADDQGNTQASSQDPLRIDSYELNSCHSIRCEVR